MSSSASKCPNCRKTFLHEAPSTDEQWHRMTCLLCSRPLLRCSLCRCTQPTHRKASMVKHFTDKHHPTTSDDADVDFSPSVTSNNNDDHNVDISNDDVNVILDSRPTIAILLDNVISDDEDEDEFIDKARESDYIQDELMDIINGVNDNIIHQHLQPNVGNITEDSDTACDGQQHKLMFSEFAYMNGVHNQLFYYQQHIENNGGIRGMAHRSCIESALNVNNMISEDDAAILFDITDNLLNKPKAEQRKFLSILRRLDSKSISGFDTQIDIPKDMKEANQLCLKNNNSLFNLLPFAPSTVIGDHACLDLDSLLDHILAKGTRLNFIQDFNGNVNSTGYNGTSACKTLYDGMKRNLDDHFAVDETAFGYLMFWSDGFVRFPSRQRDNSIWMLVVRVCPPEGSSTSANYNFCIAFGNSSLDHEPVVEYYLDQLKKIRRGKRRYYGCEKHMINTCFDLALWAGDTPERRMLTDQANRGHYGKRSHHAGKVDEKKTPSCIGCYKQLVQTAFSYQEAPDLSSVIAIETRLCNRCCNWDQLTTSTAREFDTTQDTDYPCTSSTSQMNPHTFPTGRTVNERYIVTIKQTFEILMNGIKAAFHEYRVGEWDKKTTRYFLQTFAINKKSREKAISLADEAKTGTDITEDDYVPALWRKATELGYNLDMFVELGMHLLGHGIVTSILDVLHQIFAEENIWTAYIDFANKFIGDIPSCLYWCKVKKLPKANWLGENLFGYQRLSLYLFGQFILNINLDRRSDLFKTSLPHLKRLISSCHVMVCMLMSQKPIWKEQLDCVIKVFLSTCHHFCVEHYGDQVTEFWFARSNFVGLLNLPSQIDLHGGFEHYYDGGFEKQVQPLKRTLKTATKAKSPTAMNKIMIMIQKNAAMDYIRNCLNQQQDEDDEEEQRRYQGGTKIYLNEEQLEKLFNEGDRPMCGFVDEEGNISVPIATGREHYKVVTFSISHPRLGADDLGMYHSKLVRLYGPNDAKTWPKSRLQVKKDNKVTYCLMLPYKNGVRDTYQNEYCIITDYWLELQINGGFDLPKYNDRLFNHL